MYSFLMEIFYNNGSLDMYQIKIENKSHVINVPSAILFPLNQDYWKPTEEKPCETQARNVKGKEIKICQR